MFDMLLFIVFKKLIASAMLIQLLVIMIIDVGGPIQLCLGATPSLVLRSHC